MKMFVTVDIVGVQEWLNCDEFFIINLSYYYQCHDIHHVEDRRVHLSTLGTL